ncbi:MAG TPA: HD domain-containing phosphohydrolase [Phycisphaerales bacterium]|nr:HD domain-containing phosphohydrolase [Phycisphaerales bacterium]
MKIGDPSHQILVVDDDLTSQLMLQAALEAGQFRVEVVDRAAKALDLVRTGRYSIVITDWEMPEMSGLELCQAIRQCDLSGYVYIILVTSHSEPAEIVEGLRAGADDFMAKPFNPAELEMRIGVGLRTLALDTRDVTIFALAKLTESRDPDTGRHLDRVRSYSRLLALDLLQHGEGGYKVDREFVRLIYSTSPLHDIGKVAIPDSVLLKPGRLTDREFEIMKAHTTIGAATLNAALEKCPGARFLEMARDIALSHHERFDGSGYPQGRVGTDVPLPARIVSVADVYDALVSKRIYKSATEHEVARGIILEGSGSQFDPEVVRSFLRVEEEFIEVHRRFTEPGAKLAA